MDAPHQPRSARPDGAARRPWRRASDRRVWRALAAWAAVGMLAASCAEGKSDEERAHEALVRGLEAHRDGDLGAAEVAYRETLTLSPDSKHAWFNLGLIEQTAGRHEAAKTHYRRALEIDPNFVQALFNLAIVESDTGDEPSARRLYEQVIEIQPIYAEAHLNLGFVLLELDEEKRAKEAFENAVALDPALKGRIPKESDG